MTRMDYGSRAECRYVVVPAGLNERGVLDDGNRTTPPRRWEQNNPAQRMGTEQPRPEDGNKNNPVQRMGTRTTPPW